MITENDARDGPDVAAARAGDEAAFERLYLRHANRVQSLVRWLGRGADEEELMQDTFVQVWRGLRSYRADAAFSTWLHRIAINVVLLRRRRTARRAIHPALTPEPLPLNLPVAARPVTPELRLTLSTAIEALDPGMRDVFVLHDVEGYLHDEIAVLLGIPSGTSASRLHRARLQLRKALT